MFLTPGAKLAQKVDVNTPLYNTIANTRGEAAAAKTVTACRTFQQLRSALHEPPTTTATRQAVKRYLSAYNYVVNESRIPSTLAAALLWVNAFDGNDHCVVNDLAIDHVAALFNLGVCEATLAGVAYRTRRTDPEAMRVAARHFQVAAGYFRAASELPTPGGIRAVTCDLYPPSLKALEMVMLGNAQQILYEITLEMANSNSILARFAIGARDFYLIAQESCQEPDVVNSCINGYVGRPAGALAAYFDVVAQSAQADASRDNHDMPQQLKRLAMAQKSATIGLNTVSALDTSSLASVATLRSNLIAALQNLQKSLTKRTEEAEDENRKVYFASPASHVPDIVGRQGVKPSDVSNILKEEPVDTRLHPFGELPEPIAEELSGVARKYADMVESMIADEVATINASSTNLREIMAQTEASIASARMAASKQSSKATTSSNSSFEEDQKAVDAVRHAQDRGGMKTLAELQGQVLQLANETTQQVQEIESLLYTEESEDRQLRTRLRVTRPTSSAVSQPYHGKVSSIRANLEQAANADKIVSAQIDLHTSAISAVMNVNVVNFVPPSVSVDSAASDSKSQRTEALVSEMQPQLANGKRLLADKDSIVQEFEKTKHLENPFTATAGISESDATVERCNGIMNKTYGDLQKQAKGICDEMTAAASFLSDANVRLKLPQPDSKEGDKAQSQMNEIYRHQAAALKFKEIMGHLEQGTVFYTREQDVIALLRRDIEGFVAARRTEAQDIERAQSAQNFASYSGMYPPEPSYSNTGPSYPPSNPGHHGPYSAQPPYPNPPGGWRRQ